MGVLEARKDAEKVGFQVVGEDIKDASNIIDYNIREEQTIDSFSVINANNQTTTGVATVIPGVNAPKLIAETSIVGSAGGGGVKIIEISDYSSVDERQPIVDKVLGGEFVMVKCKYPPYSNILTFFFTPCGYITNQSVRFCATYAGVVWIRISCWISGTTVTSVGGAHGQWNTNG